MCDFEKGKTSLQTEAIEILKRGCNNVVPTDSRQYHIEFCYISENWLVVHNTGLFKMTVGVLTTCHTQYT